MIQLAASKRLQTQAIQQSADTSTPGQGSANMQSPSRVDLRQHTPQMHQQNRAEAADVHAWWQRIWELQSPITNSNAGCGLLPAALEGRVVQAFFFDEAIDGCHQTGNHKQPQQNELKVVLGSLPEILRSREASLLELRCTVKSIPSALADADMRVPSSVTRALAQDHFATYASGDSYFIGHSKNAISYTHAAKTSLPHVGS